MPEVAEMPQTKTGQEQPAATQNQGQSTAAAQGAAPAPGGAAAQTGAAGQGAMTQQGAAGAPRTTGAQTSPAGRRQTGNLSRRGDFLSWPGSPFVAMRSLMDEMDRLFEGFPFGAGLGRPSPRGLQGQDLWQPHIEVAEREGNLVVCADLPGLKKEDVHLELRDDALILDGERRQENVENREGFYRSERSYGRFSRVIPLPEGVNPEQARANFKDGVLEVSIPLPDQSARRGRRIEIQ